MRRNCRTPLFSSSLVFFSGALLAALLFAACGERQDPADFAGGIPIGTELRKVDLVRTLKATGAKLIVAAVYMPD